MQYLVELYNELLVATAVHKVFSVQVIIAISYAVALVLSFYRALRNRELFSDFLSIAVVVFKYQLTSLLMEKVLIYVQETGESGIAQNVYLSVAGINLLSLYILYKLHQRFSYKYGELFLSVFKLTIVVTIAHLIVWVKFVVLNIQEEHAYIHYMYSFIVLYISIVLAVVMLFPGLLKTKLKLLLSPSWPFGTKT
ncbi:hypothetical protein [Pseudoalteromonas gelatinilytica]|uniref:Uncharacterized protein n=2 Tax=Pseudoalteromonas TaxID=53246 RepID=A0A3A3ELM0_9GAMM|nr:hypothetical protein [Pseudoalteromonas profundi]RJF37055.1 hypothetical protein D4741_02920 [Pseudoalteromonas profundi]